MVRPLSPEEAMYDRYDDLGEHDAATLRAMTGFEPDNVSFSSEATQSRLEAREYYGHEFNLHTGWERSDAAKRAKTSQHIAELHAAVRPVKFSKDA